jgi:hypothetical protein
VPKLELRHSIALCCISLALGAAGVHAQSSTQKRVPAAVLDAVIRYRRAWLADSTRFDACSVWEWTGGGTNLSPGGADPARVLLVPEGNGCVRGRVSTVAQAARRVVVVDSAAVDSVARVTVTVRHGEYTHRETFSLVPHRAGATWGVRDVKLWGAIQSSPPPRGPRR